MAVIGIYQFNSYVVHQNYQELGQVMKTMGQTTTEELLDVSTLHALKEKCVEHFGYIESFLKMFFSPENDQNR